ncbi:MAG: YdbL family protein, partial [Candidatus Brocadiaceae bacterium]|nr:YdbL family protein [Candidatus Brocadiaceae bacterium]
IVMILGGIFANVSSFADDLNAIKAEMEKRLPAIIELKSKGIVGEDNSGYLQFVGGKREKEAVVQAENQDREKVYSAIAKKEGVSINQVGQLRATQIAEKAKKGEWLQGQDGKWYQK